jgi:hypothetical protein
MLLNKGFTPNGRIINADSLNEMWRVQNTNVTLDKGQPIGLGFWRASAGILPSSVELVFHGGDDAPYHALSATLPNHNVTIAITSNSGIDSMVLQQLAESLALIMLDIEENESAYEYDSVNHDASGLYAIPFGHALITRKNNNRYMLETGLFKARVKHEDDGRWSLQYRLFGWLPLPVSDIAAMTLDLSDQQVWMNVHDIPVGAWSKVESSSTEYSETWLARQDIYTVEDAHPHVEYERIKVQWNDEHSTLLVGPYLGFGLNMMYPATPLDNSNLRTNGYGRNLGEVIEWLDEDRLKFSGAIYSREES